MQSTLSKDIFNILTKTFLLCEMKYIPRKKKRKKKAYAPLEYKNNAWWWYQETLEKREKIKEQKVKEFVCLEMKKGSN